MQKDTIAHLAVGFLIGRYTVKAMWWCFWLGSVAVSLAAGIAVAHWLGW
jgi:hypothetical protein